MPGEDAAGGAAADDQDVRCVFFSHLPSLNARRLSCDRGGGTNPTKEVDRVYRYFSHISSMPCRIDGLKLSLDR